METSDHRRSQANHRPREAPEPIAATRNWQRPDARDTPSSESVQASLRRRRHSLGNWYRRGILGDRPRPKMPERLRVARAFVEPSLPDPSGVAVVNRPILNLPVSPSPPARSVISVHSVVNMS